MNKQIFTAILMLQDEGGYQVFFPYYPNCTTDGNTMEEALDNGKDALEGLLIMESRHGGDPVPAFVLAPHVVVADIDIEVPGSLADKTAIAAEST